MFEIKVPGFGESIQEVQVANWLKQVGDYVNKDDDLVELESEKASQNLPSDFEGVLTEIKVANGEFAAVGDLLGIISPQEGGAGSGDQTSSSTAESSANGASESSSQTQTSNPSDWIMPAAERILSEYKISADAITPTGPGGRLLKEDVLSYIETKGLKPGGSSAAPSRTPAQTIPPASITREGAAKPASPPAKKPAPASRSAETPLTAEREEKSMPMSMIRRTIAKRLVEAQQTAALLTTFNEIDMQPVKELRSKYKDAFLKKHGVKLGFMSFFAKAVVEGIATLPSDQF